jgi:hypothetical protein
MADVSNSSPPHHDVSDASPIIRPAKRPWAPPAVILPSYSLRNAEKLDNQVSADHHSSTASTFAGPS